MGQVCPSAYDFPRTSTAEPKRAVQNSLAIRNLSQLVTVNDTGTLGVIDHGAMVCDDGMIRWIGPEAQLPVLGEGAEVLDGHGGVLTPGLVDSHTHLLYAGSREKEFVQRVSGATFQEIQRAGGGILSTVKATRAASREELVDEARARLDSFLSQGITTVEVKSGYGLTTADELKMLEALEELDGSHPIDVVPTFMAAHAVPPEFAGRRSEYVRLILGEMIPEVARRKLAEFCDVFCDEIAFSVEETEAIFAAATRHGMKLKVHAEQFSLSGGAAVAAHMNACSADHLDYLTPELEGKLASSNVVAVLTPGVNHFLGLDRWPPARRLLDAGIKVALSTDYSPGACMTENLALIMNIACVRLGMRPDEALRAATLGGAQALDRESSIGSLAVGKRADAVLWSAPAYEHIVYHFGVDHVRAVVKDGKIAYQTEELGCLPR
jgi:imidazolonepropionase